MLSQSFSNNLFTSLFFLTTLLSRVNKYVLHSVLFLSPCSSVESKPLMVLIAYGPFHMDRFLGASDAIKSPRSEVNVVLPACLADPVRV